MALLPSQTLDLALVGPIFGPLNQAVPHRIIADIFPFFFVSLPLTQARIPMVGLPGVRRKPKQLRSSDLSRETRLPIVDPFVEGHLEFSGRCEEVDVVGHHYITADAPSVRLMPGL